jgi:hypothetical protein
MQQQDIEQNPSPLSAQSDLSTTAETNGHSLIPNKVDDQYKFTFDAYSEVPCDATGDELQWGNVPWEGQGVASRDPSTEEIRWEWKGPTQCLGEMCETDYMKNSHRSERGQLRQQISMDGRQSRYIQTFGQRDSEQPGPYPHIVDRLLVGRWTDIPASSFTINGSSAEKDADPKKSSARQKEGQMVDEDWVKVPGHRWETVHKTGTGRSVWRPLALKHSLNYDGGYSDPSSGQYAWPKLSGTVSEPAATALPANKSSLRSVHT